jgi:hypothetical protein
MFLFFYYKNEKKRSFCCSHLASFNFFKNIAKHAIAQSSVRIQTDHLLLGETTSVLGRLLETLQSFVVLA